MSTDRPTPDPSDERRDQSTEDLMDTLAGSGPRPDPDPAGDTTRTQPLAAAVDDAPPERPAPAPAAAYERDVQDVDRRHERRGVRVGTVVWGLVVAAVGLGMLAFALGYTFDVELAIIVLVAAAGAALLVGTLVTSARRRS